MGNSRIVLLFLIHAFGFAFSQQAGKLDVGFQFFTGKSTGRTSGLISNNASTAALSIHKHLNSQNAEWIAALNAKSAGIALFHTDMEGISRNDHYGKSYGAVGEINFGLLERGDFQILFSPGIGLAFMDRTTFTHPHTYIFGSQLNAVFKAGISALYSVNQQWKFSINSQFAHFSNGSFQLPNAGVNILSAGIGIHRYFELSPQEKPVKEPHQLKKNHFEFTAGIGKRGKYQQKKSDDVRYHLYGGYRYQINNIFALKIGTDAVNFAHLYNPDEYVNTIVYLGASNEHWRIGARIGAEAKLNRLAIGAGAGRYLYFKTPYNQKTYWNVGLRYYFTPQIGVETALHANKFQADFASAGIFVLL